MRGTFAWVALGRSPKYPRRMKRGLGLWLALASLGASASGVHAQVSRCPSCHVAFEIEKELAPKETFTHGETVPAGNYFAMLESTKAAKLKIEGDIAGKSCKDIGPDDELCFFKVEGEGTTVKLIVENGSSPSQIRLRFGLNEGE